MWILLKFMPTLNCTSKENIRHYHGIPAKFTFHLSTKISFHLLIPLCRRNQDFIKELSTPEPGSKDLYFPTKYSQSFITQCKACFWKQYWSYWRNPQYNTIRFFMTIVIGALFGIIFWNKGEKT